MLVVPVPACKKCIEKGHLAVGMKGQGDTYAFYWLAARSSSTHSIAVADWLCHHSATSEIACGGYAGLTHGLLKLLPIAQDVDAEVLGLFLMEAGAMLIKTSTYGHCDPCFRACDADSGSFVACRPVPHSWLQGNLQEGIQENQAGSHSTPAPPPRRQRSRHRFAQAAPSPGRHCSPVQGQERVEG